MEWFTVTFAIYRKAFRRAAELTAKNWPLLGTVFAYSFVMSGAAILTPMLGIIGGFLLPLVSAACIGSFLHLVEMMVRTNRATLEDFKRSFGAYLWDVLGVAFVFWLFFALAVPVLLTLPQGYVLVLCLELAIFVFFNAIPELIYLSHFSSLALLQESYAFVTENWIEWFPANILAALILYAVAQVPLDGALAWAQTAVLALLIYFAMVMRGLLFIELHGTSRRGRAFRHRMGS